MSNPLNSSKVFITHSWHDIEFARRLYDDLNTLGFNLWLDDKTLQAGHRMAEEISKALEWCDVYIPVISRAALASDWCWEEINAAITLSNQPGRNRRPQIISVVVEDCEIPVLLAARLYINFAGRYEAAVGELLQKGLAPSQMQVVPAHSSEIPKTPSVTPSARRVAPIWTVGIITALIAVICLFGGVFVLPSIIKPLPTSVAFKVTPTASVGNTTEAQITLTSSTPTVIASTLVQNTTLPSVSAISASPTQSSTPTFARTQVSTSDIQKLTSGVGNNYSPSFSPDGNKIVFISTRDGKPEIYIMNSDGSQQRGLTNRPDIHEDLPSFSPDGSLIIFGGNNGRDEDLYVMNVNGSQLRNISNAPSSNEGRPRFVPSQFVSLNVIFDSDRTGNWEIYLAPFGVTGLGNVTQVTHQKNYNNRLPSYVPSTRQILFRSDPVGKVENSRINLIGTDGNNLIQVSRDYNDWYPVISHDGKWIVFVSDRDGNEELYLMNLDGNKIERLTNNAAQDTTPTLSPDNVWLVFASGRDGDNLQLFRMRFNPPSP